MKKCCVCKKRLKFNAFSKNKRSKDGYQGACKKCFYVYYVKWNPIINGKRYGIKTIDPSHDKLLFKFQNGKCAICGMTEGRKRHHRDHDHRTGWLRGYLCSNCNHFLPSQYTDKSLSKALSYFRSRQTKEELVTLFMGYLENPPYFQMLDSLGIARPTGTWREWNKAI